MVTVFCLFQERDGSVSGRSTLGRGELKQMAAEVSDNESQEVEGGSGYQHCGAGSKTWSFHNDERLLQGIR